MLTKLPDKINERPKKGHLKNIYFSTPEITFLFSYYLWYPIQVLAQDCKWLFMQLHRMLADA
jgi:hypothetical protein